MSTREIEGTYLRDILINTANEVTVRKVTTPLADVEAAARTTPTPVDLIARLREPGVSVIAEFKRASPSKGLINPDATVDSVARAYLSAGAAGISVLTDERFFRGSLDDLREVAAFAHAAAPAAGVLRKDFVIDSYQIAEARAAGADCVLLIVAALDDDELRDLYAAAADYGLQALVEVHDEQELERALAIDATLLGINSRDLRSFAVDLGTIERVAAQVPPTVTLVGESGIRTRADVERLEAAGVHAILVGETLMRAADPAAALRELVG
ncbi:MAG: indole-3-glycerol phosphate synthase TrpC [Thermomicrobiales bacterium]|nr:indole-3-glycerol phosphate synthase TrpC [Thermomicrobiales bacterium]